MVSIIFETLINYYLENPLAQSIGILALGIISYGFSQKNDTKLKYISGLGILLLGIHFILLGFYIAALVNFVAVCRNIISVRFTQNTKMVILFSIIYLSLFFITFESKFDILLIIAGLIMNYAYFKFSGVTLRGIILGNSIIWLFFNIYSQSIGGAITSISIIITILIPIISHHISKNHLKTQFVKVSINQIKKY